MKGLAKFLEERRDHIVRKIRTNVVRKTVGYSEYTQWDTTVSYDEEETVDFDALMAQIAEFENSFKTDALETPKDVVKRQKKAKT